MNRIIVLVCLVGLAVSACGPATPEPVTGGEQPVAGEGEGTTTGAPEVEPGLERPVEPIGGEPVPPTEPGQGGVAGADRDADGILDAGDRCPDEPEDRDGFQDEDGCPEPDNDQDGLSDIDDMCPAEPEDMDGQQDLDGCPDR
jgi:hypothetical protein